MKLKYRVGQKVIIRPKDGMQYGYDDSMKKLFGKTVTIVRAGTSRWGDTSLYNIEESGYNYGDDVLTPVYKMTLGGKIL